MCKHILRCWRCGQTHGNKIKKWKKTNKERKTLGKIVSSKSTTKVAERVKQHVKNPGKDQQPTKIRYIIKETETINIYKKKCDLVSPLKPGASYTSQKRGPN